LGEYQLRISKLRPAVITSSIFVFTVRCYASAYILWPCVSRPVCSSVRPFVTSRGPIKMVKRIIQARFYVGAGGCPPKPRSCPQIFQHIGVKRSVLWPSKWRFRSRLRARPRWGSSDPLVNWRGNTPPIPYPIRRFRHLKLGGLLPKYFPLQSCLVSSHKQAHDSL